MLWVYNKSDLTMYGQTKKASYVHNIRKFMSLKNDSVVRTMSVLEFDFCFHLEYNPDVKSHCSQPESFHYLYNGRRCRYTSDFLVNGQNGQSAQGNQVWTEPLLKQFIASPKTLIPGTYMGFTGLKNTQDQQVLVDYLSSLN